MSRTWAVFAKPRTEFSLYAIGGISDPEVHLPSNPAHEIGCCEDRPMVIKPGVQRLGFLMDLSKIFRNFAWHDRSYGFDFSGWYLAG